MEAQAAAQKLAEQRMASLSQVESSTQHETPYVPPRSPQSHQAPSSSDDLPTDLSMDVDEKARLRERLEREQQRTTFASATILPAEPKADDEGDRDREQHEPRAAFDFRLLMPQVTLKTEKC